MSEPTTLAIGHLTADQLEAAKSVALTRSPAVIKRMVLGKYMVRYVMGGF
jgi:hypothetical protein